MQPQCKQSIFVGYYEEVESYRLYVPLALKVIFQGDVPFDEESLACMPTYYFLLFSSSTTSCESLDHFYDGPFSWDDEHEMETLTSYSSP